MLLLAFGYQSSKFYYKYNMMNVSIFEGNFQVIRRVEKLLLEPRNMPLAVWKRLQVRQDKWYICFAFLFLAGIRPDRTLG